MNKTFKKMLSLVIALAMVMAMGLTAFAEEAPTYTITITKDSTENWSILQRAMVLTGIMWIGKLFRLSVLTLVK